uniref:Protein kinase domain-containing protein n=1 Tax=Leersia perrieri TaxID=77586 RepID=A0A0D9W252_9ORYZ
MAFWLLVGLLLLTASAAESFSGQSAGCQTKCGNVDILYPFGIGAGCFNGMAGFEILCNTSSDNGGLVPTLAATKPPIPVQSLSVHPDPVVEVMLPVAYNCYNSSGDTVMSFDGSVDLKQNGAYRISDRRNMFVVLGCNTIAFTQNGYSGGKGLYRNDYYAGCTSYCSDAQSTQDDKCAGLGCCHVEIAPGLTDNNIAFQIWPRGEQVEFSPCDYAFLVGKDNYHFRRAHLKMNINQTMPVWLDWAIRNGTAAASSTPSCPSPEAHTKKPADYAYACLSDNSECVNSTNGPGYYCKCSKGYRGNPYVADGCKDIDECADKYPCYGDCTNTPGDYDCTCRRGYQPSGGGPKEQECSEKFPLPAQLALGITLGFSFLVVAVLFTLILLQKRKIKEHFKKNGGSVLQGLDSIMIFSKHDLKKITKNNSEVIGQGGFGKVYKGMLEDNTMVAVKTSIEINKARKEDFTNEVTIQSQMMHNNIIKLLGCCLEVDVPMLVYEFAANGSLQDILHGDANHSLPLTLDLRLDIATQSAEGLRYMHSSTNHTIRHGDIKPANILLTDKFVPKISDFGTSKLLTVDKDFTMFVVGSMGYIDPVFHKTGRLTQKSDVYSFGVVLLELISRKPTIYGENCSLIIEFQKAYDEMNTGRDMFDKEIAIEEQDIFILEEIGRLAIDCLKEKVEERPDMNEVAERLVILRRARKHGPESYSFSPTYFDENSIERTPNSLAAEFSANSCATLSAS